MTKAVTLSDGSEVSLPLVCDDGLACFEVFRANVSSLPELPSALEPLSLRGKTACVVLIADYRGMNIGPYFEMTVMSPVKYRGKGKPPITRGVFVHEIAVTSEISKLAGREVWGFPKYIADIRVDETSWKIRASVESPESSFEISLPRWGIPLPASAPLPVFTVKDDHILLSYIRMSGILFLAIPTTARIILHKETPSLSFLGRSARALASGFMKVSKATLGGPVFEERL